MSTTPPVRKRNRLSLSCNYCRKRKVKCDREKPCASCVKHHVGDLCDYSLLTPSAQSNITNGSSMSLFSARAPKPVDSGITKPVDQRVGNEMGLELEEMRLRIKALENSFHGGSISSPSPALPNSSALGSVLGATPALGTTPLGLSPLGQAGNIPGTNLPRLEYISAYHDSNYKDKLQFTLNEQDLDKYARERFKFYTGKNPIHNRDEIINYTEAKLKFKYSTTLDSNCGVFTWLAFVRKDPLISAIYSYLVSNSRKDILQATIISAMPKLKAAKSVDAKTEHGFRKQAMENNAQFDTVPYTALDHDLAPNPGGIKILSTNVDLSRNNQNSDDLALGLIIKNGSIFKELELADQIRGVLPYKDVVWTLISKFFVMVYPLMPFLDEASFKMEITRIIGAEDHQHLKIEKLNVEKRLDFAYLGILLIILRLPYLCLFSNRPEVNEYNLTNKVDGNNGKGITYLLSNPIPIEVLELAQLCLNKFNLMRKTELPVLQLLYALRFYHMHGPEEGDNVDGGGDQVPNGLIVHVAYGLGLNREPKEYDNQDLDEPQKNLYRKLWFCINFSDFQMAHQFGNQLAINPDYSDIQLPFYEPGNSNIFDLRKEQSVIAGFSYFTEFAQMLRVLIQLTVNIKGSKISEIADMLTEFEIKVYEKFGILADYMVPFAHDQFEFAFTKMLQCRIYLHYNNFLMSNYFHLYLHYYNNKNISLSLFYFKKLLTNCTLNLMPYFFDFYGSNHVNFGIGADLLLNPNFIALSHRITQIHFSFWAKINATIHYLKNSSSHQRDMQIPGYYSRFTKYVKLSKYIHNVSKFGVITLAKISNRYYYAWRICKVYNFLIKFITKNEIYNHIPCKETAENIQSIDDKELDDLLEIYDVTIRRISQRKQIYESAENITKTYKPCHAKDQPPQSPMHASGNSNWWPFVQTDVSNDMETSSTETSYTKGEDIIDNKTIDKFWMELTGGADLFGGLNFLGFDMNFTGWNNFSKPQM